MDQRRVLDDVRTWATDNENIRLVVLTGSLALGTDVVDDLSDLDVELYVVDPRPLLDGRDWYQRFGQVLVVEELENPEWHPTRLVYYVNGKIDFMIAKIESTERGIGYARPYRIVVDKDGLGKHLYAESDTGASAPTPGEVETCINWFYAASLMWAKAIVRGELWAAKVREWDANSQLLQMIEWNHKSRYGWDYDTWHLGAHMREWMDADILPSLGRCWADFSKESMESALSESVALFDDLTRRTRSALGLNSFDSAPVRQEMTRLLRLSRDKS